MLKIVVAGLGYVGTSNAVLFARHHMVTAVDISAERVAMINAGISPVVDPDCAAWLAEHPGALRATTQGDAAFRDADFVVVATPSDYDPQTNRFDTSSVEAVIRQVRAVNRDASIVIRSTIPVGFTERLREERQDDRILFAPEFLREGNALHDNLHPSRIVVGGEGAEAARFARILRDASLRPECPILLTAPAEAEAIKLFANTYLALRVAFFNELDSFAMARGLDSRKIIDGIGLDPRIGGHYNNPSFGYGGYCLPKDSRQLLANFQDVPQKLIAAVVEANATRKDIIARDVLARRPRTVGVFRLAMKVGSDNFRHSAVLGVMDRLRDAGVALVVYEPMLDAETYEGIPVERDLAAFKARSDVILANRWSPDLEGVEGKVYSRDLFGRD
ncbi:nucleotide sugar dehydrogenase [Pararhodobacter sp.]